MGPPPHSALKAYHPGKRPGPPPFPQLRRSFFSLPAARRLVQGEGQGVGARPSASGGRGAAPGPLAATEARTLTLHAADCRVRRLRAAAGAGTRAGTRTRSRHCAARQTRREGRADGGSEGGRERGRLQCSRSSAADRPPLPRPARSRLSPTQLAAGYPEPRIGTTGASLPAPTDPKHHQSPAAGGAPFPSVVPSHPHGVCVTPPRQRAEQMMPLASSPRKTSRQRRLRRRSFALRSGRPKFPPQHWTSNTHPPPPQETRGNAWEKASGVSAFLRAALQSERGCSTTRGSLPHVNVLLRAG